MLVWDKNANGTIDSGAELFGNNTVLPDGTRAPDGFAALAALNTNHDGKIDSADTAFAQLRLWQDRNSNGLTDAGELTTLTAAGIRQLNLDYTTPNTTDDQGNQHQQTGSYLTTAGATRTLTDVWFATDTARTQDLQSVVIPDAIAALPEVAAFGNVSSLHQAMARDTSGRLKSLVEAFIKDTNPATRATTLTTLIYAWAGVENVDPASRGGQPVLRQRHR